MQFPVFLGILHEYIIDTCKISAMAECILPQDHHFLRIIDEYIIDTYRYM